VDRPRVVIIGAGPAGLTAALELVRSGRAYPVVLEASREIGGISRTVNYKGNRMDIGGHRFFSKSDWVMEWWRSILPITDEDSELAETTIAYRNKTRSVRVDGQQAGKTLRVRRRLSRIYFLRKYFDYPIKLNRNTLSNLGGARVLRIAASYAWANAFPRRPEKTLEDFLRNRFGRELYRTFFRDYTEKVWGVPCQEISAEWGAQRIKGLSVLAALRHALKRSRAPAGVGDRQDLPTSLVERFLYPSLGPGQLWEEVARQVVAGGGEIHLGCRVSGFDRDERVIRAVRCQDEGGEASHFVGDYFVSTMPVKDLVGGMSPPAPVKVAEIASALPYRDFITVGLLVARMQANTQARSDHPRNMPPDNWIYIQESDVRIGRLQVFNNWSPDLVADRNTIWLGLEYFCQEGDDLWSLSDEDMRRLAVTELARIGMVDPADVLDGTVIRVPKSYPAYFGAYQQFQTVREWLDGFENLFLIGRNGMHRYNNQDHSMLTAKLAVEAILSGSSDKTAIWEVNIDDDYHEEKRGEDG